MSRPTSAPFAAFAAAVVSLAVAPLCGLSAVRAQSMAEVIEGMYAAVERQAAGIQNYTLSQRVMGYDTFSYFEREELNGHPVFRLKMSDGSGFSLGLGGEDIGLGDVFVYGPTFLEHGTYEGTEQIDNATVHVLTVEGDAAAAIAPPRGPDQTEYRPRRIRLYVDAQMMVPRRILLEGEALTDAGPQPLDIQLDMMGFLPIETLMMPFKTTLTIAGMSVDITMAEVLIDAGRPEA